MNRMTGIAAMGLLTILLASPAKSVRADDGSGKLELRDGDRVVLIGSTFIEREQRHGHIETALTLAHPEKNITFRNLGWSGDTVFAVARDYFEKPEDGYQNLLETVDSLDPTVLILGYGANESFQGEAGLDEFLRGYDRLLGDMEKHTDRIVLLSPTPHEDLPDRPELPDVAPHNQNLKRYAEAIEKLAADQGYGFIDLYDRLLAVQPQSAQPLTYNGIHLTADGYQVAAGIITSAFSGGEERESFPGLSRPTAAGEPAPKEHIEQLRRTIVRKNELFFHRYRPANVTYLYLFRKHEQGNNASEILEFDPLIEEQEERIAELRETIARQYQQAPDKGDNQ